MDTDLGGGGDHGYLDLVLSDVDYMRTLPPSTPFQATNFLPPLTIDELATAVQAVEIWKTHNEQIHVYRECKNVEKSFLWHIHTALDDKYIEHIVDYDTGLIEDNIPAVLNSSFTNYGKVQSEEVKSKKVEVLNLTFNPADSMVSLYSPIK